MFPQDVLPTIELENGLRPLFENVEAILDDLRTVVRPNNQRNVAIIADALLLREHGGEVDISFPDRCQDVRAIAFGT